MRLKVGRTTATPDAGTNVDLDGLDLPRAGVGESQSERRRALIPDERNDENLAVAQTPHWMQSLRKTTMTELWPFSSIRHADVTEGVGQLERPVVHLIVAVGLRMAGPAGVRFAIGPRIALHGDDGFTIDDLASL